MMPRSDRGPRPAFNSENEQDDLAYPDSATCDALQNEDQLSNSDNSSIESVAISEEDRMNSIKDVSLANLMKGLPVTKFFEKFGPDDGIITGHAVCQDGYLLHQITYNDGQVDEISFHDAMKLHHLYLQVHSKESSPLTPPTMRTVDPWFNPLAPPRTRVAEGSGIDSPISLPIPTSLQSYCLRFSHGGKIVQGKISRRAVTEHGLYLWCIQIPGEEVWIDNDALQTSIGRSKILSRIAPPKKRISDFPALTSFVPSRSDGWHFTTNEVVGRAACVHLTPESEPPRGTDSIRRRRGRKKPTHTVIIEAAFRGPDGDRDTQYWARLQSDPTRSIIFTTPQLAVDAIHAQEALRASNRKIRNQNRARYASGTPLEPLGPGTGDFAYYTIQGDLLNGLNHSTSLTH